MKNQMVIKNNIRTSIKDRRIQKTLLRGSAPHLAIVGALHNSSTPYLMLNLPFACNYHCLKCCNLTDNYPRKSLHKRLTLDQLQQLIEEANNLGFIVLVIAGEGEPLLDKQFRSIVSLASKNRLIPYIFTNGTHLDENTVSFLVEHRASLIISLDSLDPQRYARLSGRNQPLKIVLENIERCRATYLTLQEQTSFGKLVSLAINIVVTRLNMDEVERVQQFCGDDIVFVCNRPTRIGLAETNWQSLYGLDTNEDDVDSVVKRFSKEHGPLGSTSDGAWCAYMRNGVSVGYDGSILTCAYAIETAGAYGTYAPGKLKEMNATIMDSVSDFYLKDGHSRCILRHPQYHNFVSSLPHSSPLAEEAR